MRAPDANESPANGARPCSGTPPGIEPGAALVQSEGGGYHTPACGECAARRSPSMGVGALGLRLHGLHMGRTQVCRIGRTGGRVAFS